MRALLDWSVISFLMIGVLNTGLNWAIMLVLNQRLGFGYWASSAVGYVLTSALSFVLNRKYSFRSKGDWKGDLARFVLVIAVCYFIANLLAKPFIEWAFSWPMFAQYAKLAEPVALIVGNVLFTVLNYFGQRFIAFMHK